jgi:endonuclease YncB( thermonuclease family)
VRKRKIKQKYSVVGLLLFFAFFFYIAFNPEKLQQPWKEPKEQKELRYLTSFEGKVIGVKDGDTFEILVDGQPEKVRLAEIDCPEKQQPFGNNAKQYASELCFGKTVAVTSTGKRDRYKRVVGTVMTEEGLNVNRELLKAGLAWHYKHYSKNDTLGFLEKEAREQKLGLWKDNNPVEPWNWRKYKREIEADRKSQNFVE